MLPNKNNFCGGNFFDWIEVMLIDKCNGTCSWCIENEGYKPKKVATWQKLLEKLIQSNKKNIIFLGGEPTLYKDLRLLITNLYLVNKNTYITTNGSLLCAEYIENNLPGLTGINISIHHYHLGMNKQITGIKLEEYLFRSAISKAKELNIKVRLNCNVIKKYIDNENEVNKYIEFAKNIGANNVRFAELKHDDKNFIDMAEILNYKYGLNDDPFSNGCIRDVVINNMPINFRQMCGLQTTKRIVPENQVLYYDGNFYNGWQAEKEEDMKKTKKETKAVKDFTETDKLLRELKNGKITLKEAKIKMNVILEETEKIAVAASGGCNY
ncbi:MAG: hypothetical protein UR21_C0024G0002 [Candidatus Woesebacteria bacterium GW2011_GWC2_31_9]|uniref:Radical SAM core domain-containing protein n=1 Tax=Candidatus Woesebacteria bacterium GW2011_GWC2_31_9 TaxID=1618586 RepID=A0A0F9YGU9_9BACT|nr:MAG: hypothetical protein UR21_C0024G0002 [Candidatus Woesebacteria bacterium GW2011_GWC2_31_9]